MSSTTTRTTASQLPDDENILREILLSLPPLPSTLPRASLVSKLWRRVVSDPDFQRRFCAHHKTTPSPLLGFFSTDFTRGGIRHVFTPTLCTPDRIPSARFSLDTGGSFLGCRHCLVLLGRNKVQALVWDPVTNHRCTVDFPPEFRINHNQRVYHGAFLRPYAGSSGAFRLVMVFYGVLERIAGACVYDSESRRWGDIISVPVFADCFTPSVLVGDALYWSTRSRGSGGLLRFDLDEQRLAGIKMSQDIIPVTDDGSWHVQPLRMEDDGGLGFAVLSKQKMQLWGRAAISAAGDNVVTAVLQRTVELDQLLSLRPSSSTRKVHKTSIVGYDENCNAIFVWTTIGVFVIQLVSMKFSRVSQDTNCICRFYPGFTISEPAEKQEISEISGISDLF